MASLDRPPVVLIVEDQEDSLAMYTIGLMAMGFQPLTAGNAEDAFGQARKFHPDVIVTDVMLGGASGLDFARQIRADPRTRDAAVIVLTGWDVDAVRQQARDAGCDRFIVKPCLPDALALEIRGLLAGRHVSSIRNAAYRA